MSSASSEGPLLVLPPEALDSVRALAEATGTVGCDVTFILKTANEHLRALRIGAAHRSPAPVGLGPVSPPVTAQLAKPCYYCGKPACAGGCWR